MHHYVFCLPREQAPSRIVAILHERTDIMVRLAGRLEPTIHVAINGVALDSSRQPLVLADHPACDALVPARKIVARDRLDVGR
ncbi:hypothetical protein [Xanthomonas melonis]|uniref:hypothetical protein n=1 Tax=Xanthomonas TaxID=338 RepID=UPI003CCE4A7D